MKDSDAAIAAYCQQLADEPPPLSERQKDIIAAAFAGALARAKVADGRLSATRRHRVARRFGARISSGRSVWVARSAATVPRNVDLLNPIDETSTIHGIRV